jgi:hypothetical protein
MMSIRYSGLSLQIDYLVPSASQREHEGPIMTPDTNCSMSPAAAICVLNILFRKCIKISPATMLFASCSIGSYNIFFKVSFNPILLSSSTKLG